MRRGLTELSVIARLGENLWKIRDAGGGTKEAIANIAIEFRLEWSVGIDGYPARSPSEADMLAAHSATTTDARNAQYTLAEAIHRRRHALHTHCLNQRPEKTRPLVPEDPLGGGADYSFRRGPL